MGFKEKLAKYYQDSYLKKYGDRLTSVRGNAVSVKVEEKKILWIFYKIKMILIVKPDRSKNVIRCVYNKNRWFKKPSSIQVTQGNLVIVQGLKGKKGKETRETIDVMNIMNLTTKKELFPVDGDALKKAQKIQYKYK